MKQFLSFLLVTGSLAIFGVQARADSLVLFSGVSSDGIHDDQVHMLTGPIDGPLTNDLSSPATFSAALNGPNAYVVTPHAQWAQFNPPPFDPGEARVHPLGLGDPIQGVWISSDPNGGAGGAYTSLYAINFNLPEFSFASLSFMFAVDQSLGTTADNGLFLNGIALAGSGGGDYSDILTFNYDDVTALLHPGDNTLYMYNANYGGPAGVLFNATFNFTPEIPEPGAPALFGLGAVISLILHCRRLAKRPE